jgi:tetratricopeptide (TPR) repeat protein
MVLVVLMLWNAAGAPASAAQAVRAHLGTGNQLVQAERYAEAADEFQQALRDDPALTQASEQLAVCYFELRDYTRARPLLEQMLAGNNSASLATYYLGLLDLSSSTISIPPSGASVPSRPRIRFATSSTIGDRRITSSKSIHSASEC